MSGTVLPDLPSRRDRRVDRATASDELDAVVQRIAGTLSTLSWCEHAKADAVGLRAATRSMEPKDTGPPWRSTPDGPGNAPWFTSPEAAPRTRVPSHPAPARRVRA